MAMDDEFGGECEEGAPSWSLGPRQQQVADTPLAVEEQPKPLPSAPVRIAAPTEPKQLVLRLSNVATDVGPPKDSVFMQNKHTYGTPQNANPRNGAGFTPAKPSTCFGNDGSAAEQHSVRSAGRDRVRNVGLQNAARLRVNQAGRSYERNNYHMKQLHEEALIASRNANRARWIEKVPYDETFELPNFWRKYMDTQGWKKIEVIGFRTGAFIAWPTKPTLKTLYLWGSDENCKAAVAALSTQFGPESAVLQTSTSQAGPSQAYSFQTSQARSPRAGATQAGGSISSQKTETGLRKELLKKPKHDEKWATLHSTTNQEQESKHLMKELEMDNEAFVTSKCDHDVAGYQGYFAWPSDELSVEEAFGSRHRLEKLDPIRTRCHCYIDYEASIGVIRVSPDADLLIPSSQNKAVTDALLAIRRQVNKMILEMNAVGDTLLKSSHVQTPSIPLAGMKVVFEDRGVDKTKPEYQVPVLTFQKDNSLSVYAGNAGTGRSCETKMRESVKNILPSLQFYRGIVGMTVTFGTFRLLEYRVPGNIYTGTVDEFRTLLADENTKGFLFPSLNPVFNRISLKERCMQATELLIPYESSAMTLQDAKLRFSGEFVFPSNDGNPAVYKATYVRSQYTDKFERESKGWCVVPDSKAGVGPEVQLDVNVIDFERCAWGLKVTATERIDYQDLSTPMRHFEDSVKLPKDVIEEISGDSVRIFEYATGATEPKYIRETMSYKFRLAQDTNYILEIFRHETFGPKSSVPPGTRFGFIPLAQQEPQSGWGVSLYHQEWDNKFGENKTMAPGETVSWKPTLTEFFPPSYDDTNEFATGDMTFHNFFKMVESVAEVLNLKGENITKKGTTQCVGHNAKGKGGVRPETEEPVSKQDHISTQGFMQDRNGTGLIVSGPISHNLDGPGSGPVGLNRPNGKKNTGKSWRQAAKPSATEKNKATANKANVASPSGYKLAIPNSQPHQQLGTQTDHPSGLNLIIADSKNWAAKNWIDKDKSKGTT